MSVGSTKTAPIRGSIEVTSIDPTQARIQDSLSSSQPFLSKPRALQFWAGAMVVLPVFLQASWAHFAPLSACFFTFVILVAGIAIAKLGKARWFEFGSLLVGVSGSWLGGCLFWGWLRSHPLLHIPVEALVLPIAIAALGTKWRLGAAFYISCLLGTAITDLMIVLTGVMDQWPIVVNASLDLAPKILHESALKLINLQTTLFLSTAAIVISFIAYQMKQRANIDFEIGKSWIVASAALTTTLWVDGLFLLTALFQPSLSGLI